MESQQPQQPQQPMQPMQTQQPQAQPQMVQSESSKDIKHWTDTLNNRLKNTDPVMNPQGTAQWSSEFFDCFNPIDTCLLTWCCPCVTFGKTHHKLQKGDLSTWSPVNASCIGYYVVSIFGFHCVPLLLQRTEIREHSSPKLKGDLVTDFLKSWCCGCCDLIQQDKEADRLLANRVVMEQPAKAGGMNYPA